jgi:hypothetical protein
MKAYLEIVELKNDIITASVEEECCEWGCPTDGDQMAGNY